MSATIIPFHDPSQPIEGEAAQAILAGFQPTMKAIAADAVRKAFTRVCRSPELADIGCYDTVAAFVEAMRRELDKPLGPERLQPEEAP